MKRFWLILPILALLWGCGGGGGGGTPTERFFVDGRVLDVATGGPLNPGASVSIAGETTTSDVTDGFFSVEAPTGTTTATVSPPQAGYGTYTFSFPATTGDVDLGDLWVGPERVTVRGTVRDSLTNAPIVGATVRFAGRQGTTNASGVFNLTDVAYASSNLGVFWGILGSASATGYFAGEFSAAGITASANLVNVGDVLLQDAGDDNPPGTPYNLWGNVTPVGEAPGSTVELRRAGTLFRSYTVSGDGRYYFWVPAGTYTVRAVKGSSIGAEKNVNLAQSNQVIQTNVELGP